MEADKKRFQDLYHQMREDAKTYNDKESELRDHHKKIRKDIKIAHKMEIEELRRESEKLFGVKKDLR
jgi:hypothetical protein